MWPGTREELEAVQVELARRVELPWRPPTGPVALGGCYVCFGLSEEGVERGWAGAALVEGGRAPRVVVVSGEVSGEYEPGLMALREGPLLEVAVRALPERPAVVFVQAAGRDHPRRAGLAVQLGAMLDLPTVGITSRTLVARGPPPGEEEGAASILEIDGEPVAAWLRTRAAMRPLVVHAGWRTSVSTAIEVTLAACFELRFPEPLRQARMAARKHRARAKPAQRSS